MQQQQAGANPNPGNNGAANNDTAGSNPDDVVDADFTKKA